MRRNNFIRIICIQFIFKPVPDFRVIYFFRSLFWFNFGLIIYRFKGFTIKKLPDGETIEVASFYRYQRILGKWSEDINSYIKLIWLKLVTPDCQWDYSVETWIMLRWWTFFNETKIWMNIRLLIKISNSFV